MGERARWMAAGFGLAALVGGAFLAGGAWRPAPASAQATPRYSECFFARQETVDTDNAAQIARPGSDRRVNIPPGWSVAGGGAYGAGGVVLLCR